jgi:hypothetical protein
VYHLTHKNNTLQSFFFVWKYCSFTLCCLHKSFKSSFSYTLINQGWVCTNCITNPSEHSPFNDDLLDSREVEQPAPTRAQAWTCDKELDHLGKLAGKMAQACETAWWACTWLNEMLCI